MLVVLDALKRAFAFCKLHWQVPLVAAIAILGFVLGGAFVGSLKRPDLTIKKQIDANKAGEKAAQDAVTRGTAVAVQAIQEQHDQTIKQLDAAQSAKVEALRDDPRAFAAYLSKLSS